LQRYKDIPVSDRPHYSRADRVPLDGVEFVADLKRRLESVLTSFDTALTDGTTGGVRITTRHGEGWISVPSIDKLPKPPCLDALRNADFLTGFTEELTSVMSREALPEQVICCGHWGWPRRRG
jgi:hypothetical protein